MITLLTMQELHGLTAQELGELHQLFSMLLIETEPDTPDRRNILAGGVMCGRLRLRKG